MYSCCACRGKQSCVYVFPQIQLRKAFCLAPAANALAEWLRLALAVCGALAEPRAGRACGNLLLSFGCAAGMLSPAPRRTCCSCPCSEHGAAANYPSLIQVGNPSPTGLHPLRSHEIGNPQPILILISVGDITSCGRAEYPRGIRFGRALWSMPFSYAVFKLFIIIYYYFKILYFNISICGGYVYIMLIYCNVFLLSLHNLEE